VLSSFTDVNSTDMGTLITFEEDENMEQAIISGIAFNRDEAKITVLGVPDRPGIAFSILGPIADANIDVDMIIQNASTEGMTDFSFTVHRNEYRRAMQILEKVKVEIKAKGIVGDDRIAKVSLVGIGMRTHAGIASRMFGTLAREGINIQMISTSEIKTSVVVDEKYMELAVRVLHKEFQLDKAPDEEKMRP
jgi:aspartate kinase